MADSGRLNEAIGLINNFLNTPNAVTSLSEMLDQRRQPSTGAISNANVDDEMRRLFRPASGASTSGNSTQPGASLNASQGMQPRYQTQQYFGGWTSKSRKR